MMYDKCKFMLALIIILGEENLLVEKKNYLKLHLYNSKYYNRMANFYQYY